MNPPETMRKPTLAFLFLLIAALLAFPSLALAEETFCEGPVDGEYCLVYQVQDDKCEKVVVPNCCRNQICEVADGYEENYGTCPADCPPTNLEFDVQNPAEGETFALGERGLLKLALTANGFPVVGAEIEVVGLPGAQLYLYNDGDHDDGSNFDNVYANRFPVDAGMAPGTYPAKFIARFRKLEVEKPFDFVVDPKISVDLSLKDKYRLGDTIDLSGKAHKKDEGAPIQVEVRVSFGNETKYTETVAADGSGDFSASYHLATIDPTGKWKVSLSGKDALGNQLTYSKEITVEAPKTKTELKLLPSVPNNTVIPRGQPFAVSVTVTDEDGKKVSGATVEAVLPDGKTIPLADKGNGVYAADIPIGFEFPAGNQQLDFKVTGTYEGLPAEGLTRLRVVVESGKINVEILEPSNVHFRIGDGVTAKLRLTYPDGTKVEEAEVKLLVNGEEAALTALETGIFGGTYTIKEKDVGNRPLKFLVKDKHGNAVEKELDIEVSGESIVYILQKNWLVVILVAALVLGGGGYGYLRFSSGKSKAKLTTRRQQLKAMLQELNDKYYNDGSLPKSEYNRLVEKYSEELEMIERDLGVSE